MNNLEPIVKGEASATETVLKTDRLDYAEKASQYLQPGFRSLRSFRAEAEVIAISNALEHTGWNRKRAAKLLSISYRGLLYKMRQHNITRKRELN